MAVTLRFQSTGAMPGNGDPIVMRGPSLTLGRGAENDVVLPDPDRVLSKRHCAIENHNGNVVVVDFSTNGTFLNYGKIALGATPTPLNDGDILSVGPYEIQVNVRSADTSDVIADPIGDAPISHGFATNAPSAADLLDAPGDGSDFLDDLLDGRDGPVGPGSVSRDEPGDDGLLPPLGDEDILPPAEDPFSGQGASAAMHTPSAQDHFAAPRTTGGSSAIPDDWDEDFLAPSTPAVANPASGNAQDPFADSVDLSAASFIPDDFGLEGTTEPEPTIEAPSPELEINDVPLSDPVQVPPASANSVPVEPSVVVSEKPAEAATSPAANDAAARAFLKSLGAEDHAVTDQELTSTLSRMGACVAHHD